MKKIYLYQKVTKIIFKSETMLNSKDRTQVILEKSGLSLSKFATIVGGKIKCRKRKIKCRIFATNYLSFNLKLKL